MSKLHTMYVCAQDACDAVVVVHSLGKSEIEVGHWCRRQPGKPWRRMRACERPISFLAGQLAQNDVESNAVKAAR